MRVSFTVHGATEAEIEERAEATLRRFFGDDEWVPDYTLDARPLVVIEGTKAPVEWEADVVALSSGKNP